ncbi:MAG: caspase family protein [Thermoguttaceae bacterium]|nr:caspase family protein [Thermoguttaceae bacterium]
MKFANTMFRTALTLVALTTILCVATTTLRNEAFAYISFESDESSCPYAEWRVFLVGTNDYSGALPDMRFAENDVDEMREHLEELGVPRENMTVLKASNPEFYDSTSSAAIETRFEEYLDSLTEDSVAFVFFSGLGFEDNGPCYAPHDFRLDRVKRTRLSFDKIAHELAESPAKFKLLCADIARTSLPQKRNHKTDGDERLEKVDASNLFVIMGCKAEENSYEIPDLEHGIFASVLLDAISGMGDGNDDGETTVREFVDFLNREVPERANSFVGREQTPDFRLYTYDLTKVLELMEFSLFPAKPDLSDLSQFIESDEEEGEGEEVVVVESEETEAVEEGSEDGEETDEVDADVEEESEETEVVEEDSEDGEETDEADAAAEEESEETEVVEEDSEDDEEESEDDDDDDD